MRSPIVVLAVMGMACSACLFTDVGENLEQSSCVSEPKSFCDELNELSPTGDTCAEWACDTGEGVCKILPFDGDDDGAPLAMCAPAGVEPDCDDGDPNRTPKVGDKAAEERCDGIDNDCDTLVDEGAYTVGVSAEPVVSGLVANFSVFQPAEGSSLTASFLYSKVLTGGGTVSTAHAFLDKELVVKSGGSELNVQSAASFFHNPDSPGQQRLLVVFGRADGTRPLVVGVLTERGNAGEEFADLAGVEHAGATKGFDFLSIAVAQESINFAGTYIDHQTTVGATTSGCGAIDGVTGAPQNVRLFGGDIESGLTTLFATDVDLGVTADPSPSPIIGTSNTGLLTAVASPSAVEVYQVTNSGSALQAELALELSAVGIPGEVDMAIRKDGTQVGVVYRDGCGGQSKIMLAILDRTGDGADGLSPFTVVEVAAGNNFQRPRILARTLPSRGWLVSWEEDTRRGKLAWISSEGDTIGEPYQLLAEPGLSAGFQIAYSADNGITAYAPGSSGSAGVRKIVLECSAL